MADYLDKFKAMQERVKARPRVPPPARKRQSFDRCTMLWDGERITFDLAKAKTCPPGFFGMRKGGGVYGRVVKVEETNGRGKVVKRTRKKAAPKASAPKATRAPSRKPRNTTKKAAPKRASAKRASSSSSQAAMQRKVEKLYAERKLGEASKLRAKMREMGFTYKPKSKKG